MSHLSGKIALVTGGSRGIGAAIARRLAADGADVAITYVSRPDAAASTEAAIRATGRRALLLKADSADAAAIERAVHETAQQLGGLDILVNNAGIYDAKPLAETKIEDFDRIVSINVRAVFAATLAAVPLMREGGRIITIGSCVAERMPFPGNALYPMTKAAVAALMQGLARELGPRGITANTVQPGPVATDMNPEDGPFADTMRSLLAIPRYAQPSDIAAAVAYLVSPEAGLMTGTTLTVDSGFAA